MGGMLCKTSALMNSKLPISKVYNKVPSVYKLALKQLTTLRTPIQPEKSCETLP